MRYFIMNKAEETTYYFPMNLGKKDTPLDMTEWNERSMAVFGRIVPLNVRFNHMEMKKMGFLEAAEHFAPRQPRVKAKVASGA
jgi:hypothetical protein